MLVLDDDGGSSVILDVQKAGFAWPEASGLHSPVRRSDCCLCSKSSSHPQLSAAAADGLLTDPRELWCKPCGYNPAES